MISMASLRRNDRRAANHLRQTFCSTNCRAFEINSHPTSSANTLSVPGLAPVRMLIATGTLVHSVAIYAYLDEMTMS